MIRHVHREYVEGCYRCELSRDEVDAVLDPEPQPGDGPEYHDNHAAWKRRRAARSVSLPEPPKGHNE